MKNLSNSAKFEAKKLKLQQRREDLPQYLLAFLFPMLTVIAAFAILQCYPFGNRTMLTVDLYHQYAPYLVAFRDKILSGDSLLYSWNDGLGNEYYAAFANYTASPLNIFCIFFTAKTMPVFIAFITAVRAGLASLTMTIFLKANDNNKLDNITVVFAASYALCGWFVTDFWNIMWCDAMILLPLLCLGLRKMFLQNSWWLYMVTLAVAIATNYFTGYFLCLFLIFFAPIYYIMLAVPAKDKTVKNRFSVLNLIKAAGKFGCASVIAGVSTAFITIPTYLILQHCSATGGEFPKDFNLTGNLFDFLGRLMVSASPSIRDGMANVHCGIVIVFMLPLFFMLPKKSGIGLRHKFGFGIALAILYLSFTNRTLNYIWHGMHFPNQIPYRESFLMPFVLVFMAYLTIRRLKSIPASAVGASIGGSFIYLVLYEKFGEGEEGYIQIGLTFLFIIVQGIALKIITDGRKSGLFCETLLTVTMLVETLVGSVVSIALVAKNEGFVGYDFYGKNYQIIKEYADSVEGSEGHRSFERSELFPNNICNIQSLYNIKGISIFSSTTRESFVKYNRNFGFHNNGINGFRNAGITRLTASLFGVRNLITIEDTKTVPPVFEVEHSEGDVKVYGNPDALAAGFMVDESVTKYEPSWNDSNAFRKTNEWLNSMGVKGDTYEQIDMEAIESDKMTTSSSGGKMLSYSIVTGVEKPSFKISIDDASRDADIYVYASASCGGTATVKVGDKDEYSFEIRSYQTICLGKFTGEKITLNIKYSGNPGNSVIVYAAQLTDAAFHKAIDTLGRDQLNVTEYSSGYLKGHIDVTRDGLMFMSVPYSEGWSARVDGTDIEITPIGDSFIGIKLGKGGHDVEISYMPAGLKAGIVISGVTVVIMAAVIAVTELMRRRASIDETSEQEKDQV